MKLFDLYEKSGRNFATGVNLLEQYNGMQHVTAGIAAKLREAARTNQVTDYLVGKLEAALLKTSAEKLIPFDADSTFTKTFTMAEPVTTTVITTGTTTPKAKALHKEHAHVHASMVNATTDEDRGFNATKIMEKIVPALDAEYDKMRGEIGDEPAEPVEQHEQGDGQLRKLFSLRTRVSRLRNKLIPKATGARRNELELELELKLKEIADIEQTDL